MSSSPLRTRPLGSTGLELTELTLGCWGLFAGAYGPVFAEQQQRTLERALELGVRCFDMAPVWGDQGRSESAVAEAVGELRSEVVYVTRAGMRPGEAGFQRDFRAASLRAQCEQSLRRLRTDHLDVWLLHGAQEAELRSEEIRGLSEALISEGKIRCFGATVAHLDDARAALDMGAQVLCLPFSLLVPRLVWDLEPDLHARRVGLLARSTLDYGLLAGRWSARKRFAPGDHRGERWSEAALGARIEQLEARRFLLQEVEAHGTAREQNPVLTFAQAAQRFVLAHEVVSSLVLGARNPAQVEASIASIEALPFLPPESLARLRVLSD
jgi:aryl-alcohol dehydrogenase-like predicted oxidoreductase